MPLCGFCCILSPSVFVSGDLYLSSFCLHRTRGSDRLFELGFRNSSTHLGYTSSFFKFNVLLYLIFSRKTPLWLDGLVSCKFHRQSGVDAVCNCHFRPVAAPSFGSPWVLNFPGWVVRGKLSRHSAIPLLGRHLLGNWQPHTGVRIMLQVEERSFLLYDVKLVNVSVVVVTYC